MEEGRARTQRHEARRTKTELNSAGRDAAPTDFCSGHYSGEKKDTTIKKKRTKKATPCRRNKLFINNVEIK